VSNLAYETPGQREDAYSPETGSMLQKWRERLELAKSDRSRYEPTWHICQSFLAGRHWVGWDTRTSRVVEMPNPQDRERHTVNVITPYHQTLLGKLYVEDLRPDLIFRRQDVESESIAEHTQKVAKFAWDVEVEADKRAYMVIHKMLTYGTSAGRCMFDPSKGDVIAEVPVGPDGKPMTDPEQAHAYVAEAQMNGEQVEWTVLRNGQIVWEALAPHNIFPPPGVEDPDYFPWLVVGRPIPVNFIKNRWPEEAKGLAEEDLRVAEAKDMPGSEGNSPAGSGRLKEHAMLYTGYEMPCPDYPEGMCFTWTGQKALEVREELPYKLKGRRHHGIIFFRYHMIDGRFWGKGCIEDLIGPQRQKNRARSQMIEMKDRNLGRVYAKKGTITASNKPVGKIMELIEIPLHADYPQETTGTPVGPWIENEARLNDEDMDRVAGMREVSLGQAPSGVSAYSAMALLSEQDERRIGPVLKDLRAGIGDMLLLTLGLIKEYWMDQKQLAVVGTDGMIEEFMYRKTLLPAEFHVEVGKHAPMPTSPAAEAQKTFDLFHAAIASGQPLAPDWLYDSLQAGRSLPLPKREGEVQRKKAEMEHYMMQQGQFVVPDPFDDDFLHLQVHREHRQQIEHTVRLKTGADAEQQAQAQDQQGAAGQKPEDVQLQMYLEMIMAHEKMHVDQAAAKAPQSGLPMQQGPRGVEAQGGSGANFGAAAQNLSGSAPPGQPGM